MTLHAPFKQLTVVRGEHHVIAIEHPFGLTLGLPGDTVRQLAVLRGALRALVAISRPGEIVHLPFEWNFHQKLNTDPLEAPPIARYLARHPWQLPKFMNRTPPEST